MKVFLCADRHSFRVRRPPMQIFHNLWGLDKDGLREQGVVIVAQLGKGGETGPLQHLGRQIRSEKSNN